MNRLWSGHRFEILFSVILAVFTVYALLDTFVIPRQYASVDSAPDSGAVEELREIQPVLPQIIEEDNALSETADKSGLPNQDGGSDIGSATHRRKHGKTDGGHNPANTTDTEAVPDTESKPNTGTDTNATGSLISWSDENISITLTQYRENDTDIYVADVTLASPEYLKTAFADDTYGRNVKAKTSVTASEHSAVLAINGDFYGARENGYVIRNGVLYRDTPVGGEVLAIMEDGSFQIVDDRQVSAQALLDAGAEQVLSFGPALLKDGAVAVTEGQEVGRAMASNPRTAIGILDNLHYLFVVADGRTGASEGLSLYELAAFLQRMGVETAYNLDGGGSSTMVFQGEVVNRPTTSGSSLKERSVSDIVYIGY